MTHWLAKSVGFIALWPNGKVLVSGTCDVGSNPSRALILPTAQSSFSTESKLVEMIPALQLKWKL